MYIKVLIKVKTEQRERYILYIRIWTRNLKFEILLNCNLKKKGKRIYIIYYILLVVIIRRRRLCLCVVFVVVIRLN
jgi:hypothetical protein